MSSEQTRTLRFQPRARLLRLLGDQLIRDPSIAVFELVKNAYDADASLARIEMLSVHEPSRGRIVVQDDGTGMSPSTVANVWLEPGTDVRANERKAGLRSKRFHRLPLGEKGVGRFAAHKLGHEITLITRARGHPEVLVNIDWDVFETNKYLSDAEIKLTEREPVLFPGSATGTRIVVQRLRVPWTRGMARTMARAITSITSPFEQREDFKTSLVVDPDFGWLEGLLTIDEVKDWALYHVKGTIRGNTLSYRYSFRPYANMTRLAGRIEPPEPNALKRVPLPPIHRDEPAPDLSQFKIGTVGLEMYIFDLDPVTLALGVSDKRGLRDYLTQNGGVRVYRDGIRVYDYGEPGNDWLDLGARRVNQPTRRLSNNIVLGAVSLQLNASQDLIEKTNREGFVEDEAFVAFRDAVQSATDQIAQERNLDKYRIRLAYTSDPHNVVLLDNLQELRQQLRKAKLTNLLPYVDKIEKDYLDMRDRLLTAAGAGLGLAVVIHEVEKGISELTKAVQRESSAKEIRDLTMHLAELVDGLTYLTRRSGESTEKGSALVSYALFNTSYRLRAHNVDVTNGFKGDQDFSVRCTRRLVVSTLMNLIDNSLYWLDVMRPVVKRIYLGPSWDFSAGPAIVFADNGPGFQDPPDFLTEPFVSRKPDGMGLGLHLASEVMKSQGGYLAFPQKGDVALPRGFDGAVLALVFKE